MDKKTLIGLIVIGAILFGFTWYNASIQQKFAKEQQEQQALTSTEEIESADRSRERSDEGDLLEQRRSGIIGCIERLQDL